MYVSKMKLAILPCIEDSRVLDNLVTTFYAETLFVIGKIINNKLNLLIKIIFNYKYLQFISSKYNRERYYKWVLKNCTCVLITFCNVL